MKLPRPVAGVVFDMDGLLIDTEAVWRDVQLAEAEAQGLDLPLSVIESLIGQRWQVNHRILQGHFGRHCTVQEQLPDGRARVRVAAQSAVSIAEQLAGWGAQVEVLDPPSVRAELARIGAELVARYARPAEPPG